MKSSQSHAWTAVDIETAPDLDRCAIMFEPLGDFDPSAVKYGNTKDPGKRAILLEEKELAHEDEKFAHAQNFVKKAALSPSTGRVIAIGFRHQNSDEVTILRADDPCDERHMLRELQAIVTDSNTGFRLVNWSGQNGKRNFDANFLYRRALALNAGPGMFERSFTDLAAKMMQHDEYNGFMKLTAAAKELGFEIPDCAPVKGESFHRFLLGTATADDGIGLMDSSDQEAAALKYLTADVDLLWQIADRMDVIGNRD